MSGRIAEARKLRETVRREEAVTNRGEIRQKTEADYETVDRLAGEAWAVR